MMFQVRYFQSEESPQVQGRFGLRRTMLTTAGVALAVTAAVALWPELPRVRDDILGPIDPLSFPDPENPGYDYRGRPLMTWQKPSAVDPDAPRMQGSDSEPTKPNAKDVRDSQDFKDAAREKGVRQGYVTQVFKKELLPALEARIDAFIAQYGADADRFIRERLPQYAKDENTLASLREIFQSTLEKRVKLYAAVRGVPYEDMVRDPKLLDSLTRQAYYDFLQSLKASHDAGETYTNATKLAGLTHWLEPNVVATLTYKYGSTVDAHVIKHAAISNPMNPEGFIENYLERLSKLKNAFGTTHDAGVLKYAAFTFSSLEKAEAYIAAYDDRLRILEARYGGVVESVTLKNAAQRYASMEAADLYMRDYLTRLDMLENRFGDKVDPSVIKQVARGYTGPGRAEAFLEQYLARVQSLELRYAGRVGPGIIRDAALGYSKPGGAESYLNSYLERLHQAEVKYGASVDQAAIKYFTHNYPETAEIEISRYAERYRALTAEYGARADVQALKYAALYYREPGQAAQFIEGYIDRLAALTAQSEKTDIGVLQRAALRNVTLSESIGAVEKYHARFNELLYENSTTREYWLINYAATGYTTTEDAQRFIDWYAKTYAELQATTGAKPYIIKETMLKYPFHTADQIRKLL